MADHLRTRIRDEVVSRLTGLATTGSNVVEGRFFPVEPGAALPGIAIKNGGGDILEGAPIGYINRTMTIHVEIAVEAANDQVDDELDQIIAETEQALYADTTIGGLAIELQPGEVGEPEVLEQVRQPVAVQVVDFNILYRTTESDPTQQ